MREDRIDKGAKPVVIAYKLKEKIVCICELEAGMGSSISPQKIKDKHENVLVWTCAK